MSDSPTPLLDWIADEISKAEEQARPLQSIRVSADISPDAIAVVGDEVLLGTLALEDLRAQAERSVFRYGENLTGRLPLLRVFGLPVVHGES